MRAVAEGDAQSLKVLLAQGTDVNCRNQSGQTPLMMAALLGHSAIVPLLLDAGADVRLRDNHGLSALEWSQRRGFADVTELLINALPIDSSPPEKRPKAEGDIRARSVNELGPAATAMLKAAHAKREADAARERNAAMQPVVSAAEPERPSQPEPVAAPEQPSQPEPVKVEEITPLAPEPDSANWIMERERRFREAARRRIEEEVSKRAEQKSVTPALNKSVTPSERPGPIPTAEPAAIPQNEAMGSSAEPEKIHSLPAQAAAAGLTVEASSRSSPQPPAVDMAATQPIQVAAAAASEPIAPGQTQPILPPPVEIETPTPAAQATSATTEPLTVAQTQPIAFSSTAESIALTTGAPGPGPSTLPLMQSKAANLDSVEQVKRPASTLLSAEKAEAKAPSGRLFTRPVIWVLLALLIGSAFVTYLVTNQLSKRELAAKPGSVVSPAPAAPPVVTKPAPFVAGSLAGAELSVPEAEYPAKVQSEGIRGAVTVLVRVNRTGGVVISAQALNGDRRLKTEAEKAARRARFSSDKLPDESKVISGTITYNFGMPRTEPPTAKPDNELPVVGGALVGAEASLPGAEYPETAKTKGVSGAVMVLVRVNRMGDVIAARALNGDTQLRTAAVRAAKKAKFSTIKLPRESLVTSGTITYNFTTSKTLATAPGSSLSPPTASPSASATPAPPAPATVKADEDSPVVGGDLAGKEVNVPKADYPPEARRKGVSGKVEMLVRVNKRGQVISWRTLSGDRLLRPAALKAAKRTTFSPEKLGNVESVLGTITYNFKP